MTPPSLRSPCARDMWVDRYAGIIENLYARHRVAHGEIALGTRRETLGRRRRLEDRTHRIKVQESRRPLLTCIPEGNKIVN